jgi:hypothetical protein
MAVSGPAIADILNRALKDAGCPIWVLDAEEAHASGQPLSDAIEYSVMRTRLGVQGNTDPIFVRTAASAFGSIGAVSGLVGIARALALFASVAHAPCLHLREFFEIGDSVADDNGPVESSRLRLPTEPLAGRREVQFAGVTSFGGSGTNAHQVVSGMSDSLMTDFIGNKPATSPLCWFPSGMKGDTTAPDTSYYITGSWDAWEAPHLMQLESEGVYSYTMTMGHNLFETFLLSIDGDQQKALLPDRVWAGKNNKVCGPKYAGQDYVWCVDARATSVRLINEAQNEAIEARKAEQLAVGKVPDDAQKYQVRFKGDLRPTGFEKADVSGMPLVEKNKEDWGVPGDMYKVSLYIWGSFKKVTWEKVVGQVNRSELRERKYYIFGDHSHWAFQEMNKEGNDHIAQITCLKAGSTFQIACDRDLDQVFYPTYPSLTATKSPCHASEIAGPDRDGMFMKWRLPSKVGDVFGIKFTRIINTDGTESERSLSWDFIRSSEVDFEELAKSHRYSIVRLSQPTVALPMTYDDTAESKSWNGRFKLGPVAREKFTVLMNDNWSSSVHPNMNQVNFRDDDYSLEGPDDGGHQKYWLVGKHEEDRSQLKPFDDIEVRLAMEKGMPKSISWGRAP